MKLQGVRAVLLAERLREDWSEDALNRLPRRTLLKLDADCLVVRNVASRDDQFDMVRR